MRSASPSPFRRERDGGGWPSGRPAWWSKPPSAPLPERSRRPEQENRGPRRFARVSQPPESAPYSPRAFLRDRADSCPHEGREETIMRKANGNLTRRDLLRRAAALAAPWFVPAVALGRGGKAAPSERITLGVIGVGPRCTYVLPAM